MFAVDNALESATEASQDLYRLTREFLSEVRSHFENTTLEGDTTIMIDRVASAVTAAAAVIVLVAPIKIRGKDKYVTLLFTAAGRLWTRRGQ